MKTSYHYVAKCKGVRPTRFYHDTGAPSQSAAHAFAGWAQGVDVILWPTDVRGVYRVTWYSRFTESFHETELTILEEMILGCIVA